MTLRIAACVAVLAGITTVVSWLMPADVGPSIAFADVQEKLAKVKSVSFTIINTTTGKPETTTYVRILEGNRSRMELPNNEILILDLKKRRMLRLFTQEKKADLTIGIDLKGVFNALDQLRNISKMKSTGELPDKNINGKTAKGFVVEERGQKVKVWIDLNTKLPLRMEMLKKEMGINEIFTDFVFDKQFDEDLFDTTPPADYVVNTIRVPKLTPEQLKKDAEWVIRPKVGFGPAKFGMSMQEVIELFGEPEEIKEVEVFELSEGESSNVAYQYDELQYRKRGFTISIYPTDGSSPTDGFSNVDFQAYNKYALIGRTFKGKTKKGIGMESGQEEIMKAYGLPSYERSKPDGMTQLDYLELGLRFLLKDDGKLWKMSLWAESKKKE